MNLLVLVEGKSSEKKIYKKWIPYLCPSLSYVPTLQDLQQSHFTIISGHGYPQYFKTIQRAFLDIDEANNVSHVLICVDSEDSSYREKIIEMSNFLTRECLRVNSEIAIIVQNHCIETWLMGNKRLNIRLRDYT